MKQPWTQTTILTLSIAIAFAGCTVPEQPGQDAAADFLAGEVVDLTYPYNTETVFWPTAEGFELMVQSEGMTERGYFYSANTFSMAEHGGTHMDAPYHFWEEGNTVDQIPPEQLMGNGIVVDVSDSAMANRDYRVQVSDFENWEAQHGEIPSGAIVLLRTGFGQYWPDPEQYMGTAERGQEAVADLHFPGLHPDAAEWIATERDIKMIGLDTPSIDYGQSTHYESHVMLSSNNIPALENVGNLDRLPVQGFRVIAMPMKIGGGSGAPVRILAIIQENN